MKINVEFCFYECYVVQLKSCSITLRVKKVIMLHYNYKTRHLKNRNIWYGRFARQSFYIKLKCISQKQLNRLLIKTKSNNPLHLR